MKILFIQILINSVLLRLAYLFIVAAEMSNISFLKTFFISLLIRPKIQKKNVNKDLQSNFKTQFYTTKSIARVQNLNA